MKNIKLFSLICFVVMALSAVGSMIQTQNSFLDKILSSATPDAFAECSGGGVYQPALCQLFTNTVSVDENPSATNHTSTLTFYYSDPNSSISPNNPPSSITLDLTANSQCTLGPSNTSTISLVIPDAPAGGDISVSVPVTAVTDNTASGVETAIHTCNISYTASFDGDEPADYGVVFTTTSVVVNVADYVSNVASVSSNYSALPILTENPNLTNNKGQIIETVNLVNSTFVAGDTVTITADSQCLISPDNFVTTNSSYIHNLTSSPTHTVYVKAKVDSVIEGNHTCVINFAHSFANTALNYTDVKTINLLDYTPNFEAKAPETLYEKPKEQTAQSTTGSIDIKLLDLPSDNTPIQVKFVNQSSQICEILSNELLFNQSNFNTKQSINVRAVKDGIYQPEVRKCLVKLQFSSPEVQSNNNNSPVSYKVQPKYILANKSVINKAAIEYNNLSYTVSINVLDADLPLVVQAKPPVLIQTGKSQFPVFGAIVIALSAIGMVSNYGFKRRKFIAQTAEAKIRNIYF